MRTGLVIPAALIVAAAYIKGRQDSVPAGGALSPPACELSDEARRLAEAQAADARELLGERTGPPAPRPAPVPPAARPAAPPVLRVARTDAVSAAEVGAAEAGVERALAEAAAVAAPPAPPAPPAPRRAAPPVWDVFSPWIAPAAAGAPRPPRTARPGPSARVAGPTVAAPAVAWPVAPPPAPPVVVPPDPLETISEWATHAVGAVMAGRDPLPRAVVEIDGGGHFSLGGWATGAGHMVLSGVTFRDRRTGVVSAADIRLLPDALVNVSDGALVVLDDPGFAPDAEGFTILVAASGPGAFAASGRYEVIAS